MKPSILSGLYAQAVTDHRLRAARGRRAGRVLRLAGPFRRRLRRATSADRHPSGAFVQPEA
jgi:hypothetical protein